MDKEKLQQVSWVENLFRTTADYIIIILLGL